MDTLGRDSSGVYAKMNNAPSNSGVVFNQDGDKLKLVFLGTVKI